MDIYFLSISFSLVFLVVTVELIRRQKIAEKYSLLWLALGLVMISCSVFPGLLEGIARSVGIYYAPSLLFLIGLIFSLTFIMHLTIVISRLQRQLTRLIQEVALLKAKLEKEEQDVHSAHRTG